MTEFQKLFINFILMALVIFGIFAFAIDIQGENDAEDPIIDVAIINNTYSSLRTDLNSLSNQSQNQKALFEKENPTSGFGTIILFSIVSSGKVFNSMVVGFFNTIIYLPTVVLGLDPALVSVLGTILIIVIIISLWVLYKLGG